MSKATSSYKKSPEQKQGQPAACPRLQTEGRTRSTQGVLHAPDTQAMTSAYTPQAYQGALQSGLVMAGQQGTWRVQDELLFEHSQKTLFLDVYFM